MEPENSPHPAGIVRFDHVFRTHPVGAFVGRKRLIQRVHRLLSAPEPLSPFLVILGEPGIGKTALFAKLASLHLNDWIPYFIDRTVPRLSQPSIFLRHLIASLYLRYSTDAPMNTSDLLPDLESFQQVVADLTQRDLLPSTLPIIAVDALDESSCDLLSVESIAHVIADIAFQTHFRFLISSRPNSIVSPFALPDPSNVITMTGRHEENLRDVRSYFSSFLPPGTLRTDELDILVDKSEGSFQYANLLSRKLADPQADLSSIIHSPPNGLEKLYDSEVRILNNRLDLTPHRKTVWRIMRVISSLIEPHTPQVICDIIGIDYLHIDELFSHIEQFLDLSTYSAHGKCKWYHSTLKSYIDDFRRCPLKEKQSIARAVLRYVHETVVEGKRDILPLEFIDGIMWHLARSGEYVDVLYYIRYGLPPEFFKHNKVEPLERLVHLMSECSSLAAGFSRPEYTVFFLLMGVAYASRLQRDALSSDPPLTELRTRSPLQSATRSAPSTPVGMELQQMVNATRTYIRRYFEFTTRPAPLTVYRRDMAKAITTAFYLESCDPSRTYQVCDRYSRACFPEPQDAAPRSIANRSAERDPVVVIQDSDPSAVAYRTSGSSDFTLLIDKPRRRVWYYQQPVDIRGVGYGLLCFLANFPPGTVVRYEQILIGFLKGAPDPDDSRPERDRIQKILYRSIWPKHDKLRRHIQVVRGDGLMITEETRILIIQNITGSQDRLDFSAKPRE